MQDSFLDLDESLLPTEEVGEASNYCHDNYNPNKDEIDEFRDSARRVGEFKHALFGPQGLENPGYFHNAILYNLRYKKKNSKETCVSDDQLKQDIENDKLFEDLSKAKDDLRIDLDIQNSVLFG